MKESFDLELRDDVYALRGMREQKGALVEFWKPVACVGFVRAALLLDVGKVASPERVTISVTDQKPSSKEGVAEIVVMRQGYYRWYWRFVEAAHVFYNNSFGMYRSCEDILMSIFPLNFDEMDDKGKKAVVFLHEKGSSVEEHSLWIKITPYEEVRD